MNLFLILIPQSLNSQFLNLAPYGHYDEDSVQKSDLVFRSNNEVWNTGDVRGIKPESKNPLSVADIPERHFEEYQELTNVSLQMATIDLSEIVKKNVFERIGKACKGIALID